MSGIPQRVPAGKRAYRQLEADHGTDPRRGEEIEPGSQAAFDTAELSPGGPGGSRDLGNRQPCGDSRSTYLLAQGDKDPPAFPGAAGGVRFRHPRIVTRGPYRSINRAATIPQ